MKKFLIDTIFNLTQYAYTEAFKGCTYAWEALGKLNQFLEDQELGKIECPVPEGVILVNPQLISIGKGTIIEPGAFIRGPCLIGRDCEIRHGAYIRGSVLIGNRCLVGHDTELKSSIFLDDVHAAHFNYVGDSILGNRVNLGAGVKLANLRLDSGIVQVVDNGQKISTHLKKMGAILGDDTQLGCNAVTNPGTVTGKGVFCYPCTVVSGYIPPQAKVKSNQKMVLQDYVDRSNF